MNAMNLINDTNGAKAYDDLLETEEGKENVHQDFVEIGPFNHQWLLDEDENEQDFTLNIQ